DQPDKNRKPLAHPVGIGPEQLIDDNHQRGDNGELHDQPDRRGYMIPHQADEEAGGRDGEDKRHAHGERGRQRGGDGKRGADTEDLQRDRVSVDDRSGQMAKAGARHSSYTLPSLRLARNGPKPLSPSQKRTRLETPIEERVAPVMPSTSYSLPAAPRTTPRRVSPVSSAARLPAHWPCHAASVIRVPSPGVSA